MRCSEPLRAVTAAAPRRAHQAAAAVAQLGIVRVMRHFIPYSLALVFIPVFAGCASRTSRSPHLVGTPPPAITNVAVALDWYRTHRGGVAGQFAVEDRGVHAFVVWSPRPPGALYTPTSTYIRPRHLDYFVLYTDQAIESGDYGDGIMRHFGVVSYDAKTDYMGYFLLPDEILSHGLLLHEFSERIKALP